MTMAEKRGIYCTGYHVNQSKLAPRGYLTGAEWNWAKLYMDYAEMIRKGTEVPHLIRGGLKEGIVKVSDYNQMVPESVRKQADAAKGKFMSGSMIVYKGPIKDNTGNVVIPAGKEYIQTDIWLESMGWLAEGVIGSTKSNHGCAEKPAQSAGTVPHHLRVSLGIDGVVWRVCGGGWSQSL
jgi:simple sugar transport system substrate-binding protein